MRTLGGILATNGIPDLTRLGWPTLRAAFPLTTFLNAMREMRQALARRSAANVVPVLAVIGQGSGRDRSIVALNVALAAARDGANVLVIDAGSRKPCALEQARRLGQGRGEASRLAQHRQQGFRALSRRVNGIDGAALGWSRDPPTPSAVRSRRPALPAIVTL